MSDAQVRVLVALLLILGVDLATSAELRAIFKDPKRLNDPTILPALLAWTAGGLTLLALADVAPDTVTMIAWTLFALVLLSHSDQVVSGLQKATTAVNNLANVGPSSSSSSTAPAK